MVFIFFFNLIFDTCATRQYLFQDPATGIMEGIIDLHHDIFFFLIVVTFFVLILILQILYFFNLKTNPFWFPLSIRHDALLEVIWTIIPTIILIIVAVPSFALLYAIDEIIDPLITVKAVGHQWFWHYEYTDAYGGEPIIFESRMLSMRDLILKPSFSGFGSLRLLEVDNRLMLPELVNIRLLVTAVDVLHSWAVPSLGVKIDACPGRLNENSFFIKRSGVFYGQCSEICGINHGFMPIVVQANQMKSFLFWQTLQTFLVESEEV